MCGLLFVFSVFVVVSFLVCLFRFDVRVVARRYSRFVLKI